MSTTTVASPTINYYEIAEEMEPGEVRVFHNVAWEEYEELLDQLDESPGFHLSYDEGMLEIMSLSAEHEGLAEFISHLVSHLSTRLRIDIRSFGSATIKKSRRKKGKEPDCCFYVQTVPRIGTRIKLDFAQDPPPDVAVEVDIHHSSLSKFPIYVGLGVPELWRYDGAELKIYWLQQKHYVESATSLALPMLTANILTRFLTQMREEGAFKAKLAFEDWLQTLQP